MSACWKTWKLCFVTVFPNQMLGFVEEMGRNFLRAQFARLQASMSTKTCGRFYYGMCGSYRMLEWCASYWDDADSATSVWENLVYYQGHICNTFLVANVILNLCINAVWVMLKCPPVMLRNTVPGLTAAVSRSIGASVLFVFKIYFLLNTSVMKTKLHLLCSWLGQDTALVEYKTR